jgi:hypothetical protein
MRTAVIGLTAVLSVAVWMGGPASARPVAAAGGKVPGASGWGRAIEAPGTAALNAGGRAEINAVSCASPGDCSLGGYYTDSSGHSQAFVASQSGGTWGSAIEVPGTSVLNAGGDAEVSSVSCAAPGDCSAGGFYVPSSGVGQAFVASEVGGTWGSAIEVPGTAARGGASIDSVSCASPGNCSVGGADGGSGGSSQAFVASEVGGTWGNAIEVPGTAALNAGEEAEVSSVSCPSPGNCGAVGSYTDENGDPASFVVSQISGTWHKAIQAPGTGRLGLDYLHSVSCPSAGNCSAGGQYSDPAGVKAFVTSEVDGFWGGTIQVPGTAKLNQGWAASVSSVSCASAGNCSAGGFYTDRSGFEQAFVVSQSGGTWSTAIKVPTTAAQGVRGVTSVSCGSAGNCSAGGGGGASVGNYEAFVVSQSGGTWGNAIEVPGSAALNQDDAASVSSVSCASAATCTAGGYYTDGSGHSQVFVASKT